MTEHGAHRPSVQSVMGPSYRAGENNSLQAQVIFLPSLKNCLANLPAVLVTALLNADAVCLRFVLNLLLADQSSQQTTQKVVVELKYHDISLAQKDPSDGVVSDKVAFIGWTGMQSTSKAVLPATKKSLSHSRGAINNPEEHTATIEIDSIFGRLLGLSDRQKVIPLARF